MKPAKSTANVAKHTWRKRARDRERASEREKRRENATEREQASERREERTRERERGVEEMHSVHMQVWRCGTRPGKNARHDIPAARRDLAYACLPAGGHPRRAQGARAAGARGMCAHLPPWRRSRVASRLQGALASASRRASTAVRAGASLQRVHARVPSEPLTPARHRPAARAARGDADLERGVHVRVVVILLLLAHHLPRLGGPR